MNDHIKILDTPIVSNLPKINPVGFNILGQLMDAKKKDRTGILLPDDVLQYPCMRILSVGDKVTLFKTGDMVLVRHTDLQGLNQADQRYVFQEDKVFATIE